MSNFNYDDKSITNFGLNNRGQKVYLRDIANRTEVKKYKNSKFIKFTTMKLNDFDTTAKDFLNVGIRAEAGNEEERIDEMENSFRKYGYLVEPHPVSVDTRGEIIGGRTRVAALKKLMEEFPEVKEIPVAMFSVSDNCLRTKINNGLIENEHVPQTQSRFADLVAAGVRLISGGELKGQKGEIEFWLHNEVNISRWYSKNTTSMASKIANSILKNSESGQSLVVVKSKTEWKKHLTKYYGFDMDEVELILIDNTSYADRLWVKILDHIGKKEFKTKGPLEVVLFTREQLSNSAKANLKTFEKRLKTLLDGTYAMMEKLHGVSYKNKRQEEMFKIKGLLPQIMKYHDINTHKLISVKDYKNIKHESE